MALCVDVESYFPSKNLKNNIDRIGRTPVSLLLVLKAVVSIKYHVCVCAHSVMCNSLQTVGL